MSDRSSRTVDIDAWVAAGRADEAEALLRDVLQARPLDVGALVHAARLAARRRDFARAQGLAAKALSQAPGHPGAALALADALLNLGHAREAAIHFRKAEALRPDIALCRHGLGRALAKLGRVAEARAMLSRLFDRHPDLAPLWGESAAVALAHAGDLAGAVELMRRDLSRPRLKYQHDACVHALGLLERAKNLPTDGGILGSLVVWGEPYLDAWLGLTLPSLLHPSNLPALAKDRRLRLRVFSDQAGRARLEASPAMARLARFATIDIEVMPEFMLDPAGRAATGQRYLAFALMHHVALHEATARRADVLTLFPDMVAAEGSYRYVGEVIADGRYDALVAQAVTGRAADMTAALRPKIRNHELGIASGPLLDLVFAVLHPRSRAALMRDGTGLAPADPGILTFADPKGVRMRMLQPLPLWISHRILAPSVRYKFSTPDDELLERLFPAPRDWARILVPENADRFCYVGAETARPEDWPEPPAVRDVAQAVADAARRQGLGGAFRRWMLSHETLFRGAVAPPWADAPDPAGLIARVVAAADRAMSET